MAVYKCEVCDTVYDEEKEGVKWDDLPDNWICPGCGSSKSYYKLVQDAATIPDTSDTPGYRNKSWRTPEPEGYMVDIHKISETGESIIEPMRTERPTFLEVYKCEVCENMVEMVHEGKGDLVCCNQPMKLMEENTVDAAKEKHIPVIEKVESGFKVKVGSIAHPMEEKHYIEWIGLISNGRAYRQFLSPGDAPEAVFRIEADKVTARAYCNIHALWKG